MAGTAVGVRKDSAAPVPREENPRTTAGEVLVVGTVSSGDSFSSGVSDCVSIDEVRTSPSSTCTKSRLVPSVSSVRPRSPASENGLPETHWWLLKNAPFHQPHFRSVFRLTTSLTCCLTVLDECSSESTDYSRCTGRTPSDPRLLAMKTSHRPVISRSMNTNTENDAHRWEINSRIVAAWERLNDSSQRFDEVPGIR